MHSSPHEQLDLFDEMKRIVGVSQMKHTFGHIDCPVCNAKRELFMHNPEAFSNLFFKDAAKRYCESREGDLRARSLYQLKHNLKQAGKFFDGLRLHQIHVGHLCEYQAARLENRESAWSRRAHASIINHEISALQSLLKIATDPHGHPLWMKIEPFYKPLPTPPPQSAKTLSDDDEMLFFGVLSTAEECEVAYWVSSITTNSGAAGTELRTLRMMDVHLDLRVPNIDIREEVAKNSFRIRRVVLNPTALKQMQRCVDRGRRLGSILPEHHVFPKRDRYKQQWDPTQPASASWLRKQWEKARILTGLKEVTPHAFRHQHITLSAEAGENPELIAKRVGHARINMTRYYTHTRENSQLKAVNAIDPSVRFGPGTWASRMKNKSA